MVGIAECRFLFSQRTLAQLAPHRDTIERQGALEGQQGLIQRLVPWTNILPLIRNIFTGVSALFFTHTIDM